jgi:hypothetical protein
MAGSSDTPFSFLCPITHEVMRDPVTTCDGQSYEHSAIRQWLAKSKRNLSPLTGDVLESTVLVRNHALRNAIGEFERARPDLFPMSRESDGERPRPTRCRPERLSGHAPREAGSNRPLNIIRLAPVHPGASKVILLGDSGVGKTCLLTRIQSRSFPEHTAATVGCSFCPHTILLPSGKAVELQLWDTAGQEKYRSFTRQYFRGSAAAVVAFDLTSSTSFEGAKQWVEELKHVRTDAI